MGAATLRFTRPDTSWNYFPHPTVTRILSKSHLEYEL
jgi:hypothetical protein